MKKRSILLITALVGIAALFLAPGIFAGTAIQDVIDLKSDVYKKHTKGIVKFSHKKHAEEYAKQNAGLYKNGCGECHHDDKGKPLALKAGDDVQTCGTCHKETGKPKKMKKKEKIKRFHKFALHENCKGCHKKFNKSKGLKKNDKKAAPQSCKACHPKK